MDDHKRVFTVGHAKEVLFVLDDEGDILGYITVLPSGEGFSVSIYGEPQPPPAVTLAMNTSSECLAALTGFLEAWRICNE